MDDYYFIYLDSTRRYNTATNIEFIAMHKACRAVRREDIDEHYDLVSDFICELNDYERTTKAQEVFIKTGLIELSY